MATYVQFVRKQEGGAIATGASDASPGADASKGKVNLLDQGGLVALVKNIKDGGTDLTKNWVKVEDWNSGQGGMLSFGFSTDNHVADDPKTSLRAKLTNMTPDNMGNIVVVTTDGKNDGVVSVEAFVGCFLSGAPMRYTTTSKGSDGNEVTTITSQFTFQVGGYAVDEALDKEEATYYVYAGNPVGDGIVGSSKKDDDFKKVWEKTLA